MIETTAPKTVIGSRVSVRSLTKTVGSEVVVLDSIDLDFEPGELIAIVGGSGAGKTTLLEAISGVRPADSGTVSFDGIDAYSNIAVLRTQIGYVPQDDIIHAELPLERTIEYAARLRLPSLDAASVKSAVRDVLLALDLAAHANVRVGALSGGQRKRASIAVELLSHPRAFFLDEATSGLDPATSSELLALLRRLADRGATVVLTTHAVQDLAVCDRVVFLPRGGRLAFAGTVDEALVYFGVDSVTAIYTALATKESPEWWAERYRTSRSLPVEATPPDFPPAPEKRRAGFGRQWRVLSARTAETLIRNKLTLAILLGSPAMVVAMFAILFKPGAFRFDDPSPSATVMIIFWIAFGGFFFGLTYGLLQICTEAAIVRRERLVGLDLGAYVLSKLTVLLPFLLVVDVLMLGVLRLLDRLPDASLSTYTSMGITLALDAAAALAIGLMTSAAVGNPSQATLALPMLCFPAVLFSGAILPVPVMAGAGQVIERVNARPMGLRSHRSRPRIAQSLPERGISTRSTAARRVRRHRNSFDCDVLADPQCLHRCHVDRGAPSTWISLQPRHPLTQADLRFGGRPRRFKIDLKHCIARWRRCDQTRQRATSPNRSRQCCSGDSQWTATTKVTASPPRCSSTSCSKPSRCRASLDFDSCLCTPRISRRRGLPPLRLRGLTHRRSHAQVLG